MLNKHQQQGFFVPQEVSISQHSELLSDWPNAAPLSTWPNAQSAFKSRETENVPAIVASWTATYRVYCDRLQKLNRATRLN